MGFQRRFYLQVQAILSRLQIMFCYCSATRRCFIFSKTTTGRWRWTEYTTCTTQHPFVWYSNPVKWRLVGDRAKSSSVGGKRPHGQTENEAGWALGCCTCLRRRTNKRIAHCTSIMSRKPEIMLDVHPPRLSPWDPSAVHSRIQLAAVWITAYDYMHNS